MAVSNEPTACPALPRGCTSYTLMHAQQGDEIIFPKCIGCLKGIDANMECIHHLCLSV